MSLPFAFPAVIGHRGAALHAPENTLAGFRKAAALGVRMIEFDAKLTADGIPILMHDDTVDRTTDGVGAVRSLSFTEIRSLDAGRWFGPAFAGERVPTLEEALATALELDLGVNIEIKPCDGRALETASVVLTAALAIWPADRPPPLVSSFALDSLRQAMDTAPAWPRGYLIEERPADWRDHLTAIRPRSINVDHEHEDAASIALYRQTGLPVLCYTVNEPGRARELYDMGVSAIFTDAPDRILALGDP